MLLHVLSSTFFYSNKIFYATGKRLGFFFAMENKQRLVKMTANEIILFLLNVH